MTNLGCRGHILRSLSKAVSVSNGIPGTTIIKPDRLLLHLSFQRNFNLLGGKKEKGKDDSPEDDKSTKPSDDKSTKPSDDCCVACPKERTELVKETTVTAKTGMKMPALILGTWKMNSLEVARKVLTNAFKVGYRAIDTSSSYGNEDTLGCALPAALDAAKLKREDIFIITKLPFDSMRCEKVNESVCKSLAKLKVAYVDLYMVNFPAGSIKCGNDYKPDPRVDHCCIWKAMEVAVESGMAKYIGVSNFSCDQLEDIVNNGKIKPSNVQVEMHPYFQQKPYRRFAKEFGVTLTGYAPFGRSPGLNNLLKDKGVIDEKPNPMSDPCILEIAKNMCKTPHQISLRFLLQSDDNVAVVAGATETKNICENINLYDFKLDELDMHQLKVIDKGKANRLFNKSVFKVLFPGVDEHPLFPWKD